MKSNPAIAYVCAALILILCLWGVWSLIGCKEKRVENSVVIEQMPSDSSYIIGVDSTNGRFAVFNIIKHHYATAKDTAEINKLRGVGSVAIGDIIIDSIQGNVTIDINRK